MPSRSNLAAERALVCWAHNQSGDSFPRRRVKHEQYRILAGENYPGVFFVVPAGAVTQGVGSRICYGAAMRLSPDQHLEREVIPRRVP